MKNLNGFFSLHLKEENSQVLLISLFFKKLRKLGIMKDEGEKTKCLFKETVSEDGSFVFEIKQILH